MVKDMISIVMGIYNCENTLSESIESVIYQTYENWELIMCDDGSNDNTLKIAEEYSNKDERIKVIKNEVNKGLAFSLNRCIEIAKGEFVARHDSDDLCYLDRFEKQIKFLKNNNIELVGTGVEYFDEDGVWGEHIIKEKPTKIDVFKQSMFSHPTILLKKRIVEEVDKYTVSNITYRTEDYDLFAKVYSKGYIGLNMQEVLYKVRRDKDAYSRRKFKFRLDESRCKYKAYKLLNIDFNKFYVVIVPLIKGLIPTCVFRKYHKMKFKK